MAWENDPAKSKKVKGSHAIVSEILFLSIRERIRVTNDQDHGLSGIHLDLISVIVEELRGLIIPGLRPGDVNALPSGEKPSVASRVMTLHGQITVADLFLLDVLYQQIAKG